MQTDRERFEELLSKYVANKISPQEHREMGEQIQSHREFADRFVFEARFEVLLRSHMKTEALPSEVVAMRRRSVGPVVRRAWIGIAACLAIALGFLWQVLQARYPVIAECASVTPRVLVQWGPKSTVASVGTRIREGNVVRSDGCGTVTIVYRDEATTVEMLSDTDIKLYQENEAKRIDLTAGTIACDVAGQPDGRNLVVKTLHAEAKVKGTMFTLYATRDSTRLEVDEGKLLLTSLTDGRCVEVAGGNLAIASAGGLIGPVALGTKLQADDGDPGVAHWRLEKNARDRRGRRHGTVYGGASFSSDCKEGSAALSLDGSNDYVDIADHAGLDIGTGDFSYAFWFKRDSNATSNLRLISKGAQNDSDAGYCVFGGDTRITGVLGNGSLRKFAGTAHGGVGVWTHLAVTVDRTGYMKIYANGAAAAATDISDWSGQDLSTTHNLNLGRGVTGGNLYWDGKIDDVRIYKKMLSATEVLKLSSSKKE